LDSEDNSKSPTLIKSFIQSNNSLEDKMSILYHPKLPLDIKMSKYLIFAKQIADELCIEVFKSIMVEKNIFPKEILNYICEFVRT